ncbi:syntaxin-2 isoform X3 [Phyllopteryx taeniolatus]|uniref:syntaxin-2 isoform X3 n=1 Tax=Phyllopteryx taeniolatus TaxID=161469 RepID=UPI002AD3E9B3|nr:syntaxin-2 isoform X3 [Phyllopteryx taeniolatus]
MKDRLVELTARRTWAEEDQVAASAEREGLMEGFFRRAEEVRGLLDRIGLQVRDVKETHSAILCAPHPDAKTKARLNALTDDIKGNADVARTKLKCESNYERAVVPRRHLRVWAYRAAAMERNMPEDDAANRSSVDLRIQKTQIISDSKITRQVVDEIESRHQDIIRLESSIRELRAMFADMATLVETQGQMVNNIEKHVSNAAEYICRAKEETKKAVRYQKKSRRKCITLAFAVLILLAVIALIVGLSVGLTKPLA